jgi:hypothetical protein
MNKGRAGEDRGSKEMDRCPLTISGQKPSQNDPWDIMYSPEGRSKASII